MSEPTQLSLRDIEDDRVYTPKQIAEALQVSSRRVIQAYREGELAGIELGPRTIRITGRAVKEWLPNKKKRPSTNLADSGAQIPARKSRLPQRAMVRLRPAAGRGTSKIWSWHRSDGAA